MRQNLLGLLSFSLLVLFPSPAASFLFDKKGATTDVGQTTTFRMYTPGCTAAVTLRVENSAIATVTPQRTGVVTEQTVSVAGLSPGRTSVIASWTGAGKSPCYSGSYVIPVAVVEKERPAPSGSGPPPAQVIGPSATVGASSQSPVQPRVSPPSTETQSTFPSTSAREEYLQKWAEKLKKLRDGLREKLRGEKSVTDTQGQPSAVRGAPTESSPLSPEREVDLQISRLGEQMRSLSEKPPELSRGSPSGARSADRIETLAQQTVQSERPGLPTHILHQVLVVVTPDDPRIIEALVRDLERRYRLTEIRRGELRSVARILVLFQIPDARSVSQVVAELAQDPRVEAAQPNFVYRTTGAYNDPHAELQYAPKRIRVDRVHRYATGKGIKVALVDTGVDYGHRDLRERILERVTIPGSGGSFVDDLHGTVLAGIIAAIANNRFGIYGIAPSVELLALKACSPESPGALAAFCTSEAVAGAVDIAILRRVDIMNLSVGGPRDRLIETLVREAVTRDILVVAAAGNSGPDSPPVYPAALDRVLAVTATDFNDELYSRSNTGRYVSLAAPGVHVLSTAPGGRFGLFEGTSIAAAHVSGVLALLLQQSPRLGRGVLREVIGSTAVDLGPPGRDDRFGWGRVDACRAFEKIVGTDRLCR